MTTTPLPPKKPEALRIADELDCHNANLDRRACKELRRQHAEIERKDALLRQAVGEMEYSGIGFECRVAIEQELAK